MSKQIIFGEIDGIEEGHWFESRKEMMSASFHRHNRRGIDGKESEGASAIILSGGDEDDKDYGTEIIYTGTGGRDPKTKKQVADQTWTNTQNAALLKSMNEGYPVRVARGQKHDSPYSPTKGYEYAGLYMIVDAWKEKVENDIQICRFRLLYTRDNEHKYISKQTVLDFGANANTIIRSQSTVHRIIRNTRLTQEIKSLYDNACQICGTKIPTKNGFYSEGAHIRPLGEPHNGEDSLDNLLCLCPNHHVMLDRGAFSISDDFKLIGVENKQLLMHHDHDINKANLAYHRNCFEFD